MLLEKLAPANLWTFNLAYSGAVEQPHFGGLSSSQSSLQATINRLHTDWLFSLSNSTHKKSSDKRESGINGLFVPAVTGRRAQRGQ